MGHCCAEQNTRSLQLLWKVMKQLGGNTMYRYKNHALHHGKSLHLRWSINYLAGFLIAFASLFLVAAGSQPVSAQSADKSAAKTSNNWSYTMRPGDTLWSVCNQFSYYENCWRELAAYNNIPREETIAIGKRIEMPLSWLQAPVMSATIRHLSGALAVIRENRELTALAEGDELQIGDRLLLADGELVIEFVDGSLLTLAPESELIIDSMSAIKQTRQSDVQVSLPTGSAKVRVKRSEPRNNFRVRTTTGVAAVRGTEFRVRNDSIQPVTRTEVLEGNVDYEASGAVVNIDSGYATLAKYGEQPIEPVELLDAPVWLPQCNIPALVEWEHVEGADHYLLELLEETASDGNSVQHDRVISRHRSEKSYYEFSGVEPGCYRLRVLGVQNGFVGLESDRQYCVPDELSEPLITFAMLEKKRTVSVELEPVIGADSYVLEFSSTADFSSVSDSVTVKELAHSQEIDQAPSNYAYVRARAISESAASSNTEAREVQQRDERGLLFTVLGIIGLFLLI